MNGYPPMYPSTPTGQAPHPPRPGPTMGQAKAQLSECFDLVNKANAAMEQITLHLGVMANIPSQLSAVEAEGPAEGSIGFLVDGTRAMRSRLLELLDKQEAVLQAVQND